MAWKVDPAHTAIEFSAKHMMITTVRGRFEKFEINLDLDENNPEKAQITATVDLNSIYTREERRDTHLRSADFFHVEQHPTMTFRSTRIERTGKDDFKIY